MREVIYYSDRLSRAQGKGGANSVIPEPGFITPADPDLRRETASPRRARTAIELEQQRVAGFALNEIDDEIAIRQLEIEALERARAVLVREASADRCDAHTAESPCHGIAYSRWCRACGDVARRCGAHGSIEAAVNAHGMHAATVHGEPIRAWHWPRTDLQTVAELARAARCTVEYVKAHAVAGRLATVGTGKRGERVLLEPGQLPVLRDLLVMFPPPRRAYKARPKPTKPNLWPNRRGSTAAVRSKAQVAT